ncbi:MAG: hypothetical protein ACRD10_05595, partial [Terriglobia bacterium]
MPTEPLVRTEPAAGRLCRTPKAGQARQTGPSGRPAMRSAGAPHAGGLIVNADDWGRYHETTGRTLDCIDRGAVSSVRAMVFMQDSERAAAIARD